MKYRPLNLPSQSIGLQPVPLAKNGENDLAPSEFKDTPTLMENVLKKKEVGIEKRKGQVKKIEEGTLELRGGIYFKGNKYFAQDDKLYVNDGTLAGNTLIHTYTGVGEATFAKFGDYLFSANGTEKPVRISRTLAYDAQTANFAVGLKITGGTSGATAIILEDSDAGTTGTLTLGNITGVFADNEIITDSATGSATVNGVLAWTSTIITNAKVCGGVFVYDQRLVLFKIEENPSMVLYSQQFSALAATPNPPFTVYAPTTTPPIPTDAGSTSFSNAGEVTKLVVPTAGGQLIAFYEDGESGIVLDTINVDTTGLAQSVRVDFQSEGLGADNAIATRDGVVVVNEGGVWFSPIQTETAYPFSLTASKISQYFGETLTSQLNFIGSSMVYDEDENRVLISCKRDASFNNFVLVFYMNDRVQTNEGFNVPYSRIKGWYIKNFFKVGREIWGTSSVNGKTYKLFDGSSDDGGVIKTRYKQELTQGTQNELKTQEYFVTKGSFADGQVFKFSFDIYDQIHILREDFTDETITIEQLDANVLGGGFQGLGEGGIGEGAIGGTDGLSQVVSEQWFRRSVQIYEFTRLIIDIEEESRKPWSIDYIHTEQITKGFNQNIR